jgi:hypothetical protein
MRTTRELITELDHNAQGYDQAALIVEFGTQTTCVEVTDPNRHRLLDEAVTHGGRVVAWYRWRGQEIELGLLHEYQNEWWADTYINGLAEIIRRGINAKASN